MLDFIKTIKDEGLEDKNLCLYEFDNFKNSTKGQEMIKKYVNRWEEIGVLYDLDDNMKERLAVAFEQLATFLIYGDRNEIMQIMKETDGILETLLFPMLRRVMHSNTDSHQAVDEKNFSFRKFIKALKEIDLDKIYSNEKNKSNYYGDIEVEANTVAIATDAVVYYLNTENADIENYVNKLMKLN